MYVHVMHQLVYMHVCKHILLQCPSMQLKRSHWELPKMIEGTYITTNQLLYHPKFFY